MAIERTINPEIKLGPGQVNFVRHWKQLRAPGHPAPTVVRWIQALTGHIAMHTYRAELHPEDCILIFAGDWLMAKDITSKPGESVYARFPSQKTARLANVRTVAHHPCGYGFEMKPKDAGSTRQSILLPLEVPAGRHLQVIGYVDYVSQPSSADSHEPAVRRWWIDIGVGVPSGSPLGD